MLHLQGLRPNAWRRTDRLLRRSLPKDCQCPPLLMADTTEMPAASMMGNTPPPPERMEDRLTTAGNKRATPAATDILGEEAPPQHRPRQEETEAR